MSSDLSNLDCPISLELFREPIVLPCCGQAVSRSSIQGHLGASSQRQCPLCGRVLPTSFDPATVAVAINLVNLVEEKQRAALSQQQPRADEEKKQSSSPWRATLHCLAAQSVSPYRTKIGKLVLSHTSGAQQFKTLLLPVIDVSGSMSGGPMTQVRYSLGRIVDTTYANAHLVTQFITYNDSATRVPIQKSTRPDTEYHQLVQRLDSGGGTRFSAAFAEIVQVCRAYQADATVTSVVVIFLTDGEDSSINGSARSELVTQLRTELARVWFRDSTIHVIGFGAQHDYEFLNRLRLAGTKEGSYRYADPREDTDSLSNKIHGLLDAVVRSCAVPIKLIETPTTPPRLPTLHQDPSTYWLNITRTSLHSTTPLVLMVQIGDQAPFELTVGLAEDENDPAIWQ